MTLSLSSDRPPKMEGAFLIHFPIVVVGDQDSIVTLHFACIQVSFSHAVLPRCLIKLGKRALHWSCARKAPCNFAQWQFPLLSATVSFFYLPLLFATLLAFSRTIFSHDGFAIMIVDHHEVLGLRAKQKEEEEDLDGTTGEKVQAASVSRIRLYSGGWALSKGGLSRFK